MASAGSRQSRRFAQVREQMPIDRDRPSPHPGAVEAKQPLAHQSTSLLSTSSRFAQGPEHSASAPRHWPQCRSMAVSAPDAGTASRGTVVRSPPPRLAHYGQSDLRLAEALADRAATAIENARLYRASVHATQLRDQVLGVVAHDLRNPLSTILMQRCGTQASRPGPRTAISEAGVRLSNARPSG